MKKQLIIPVSISLMILLAFSACKKDKGNYNYTDPGTISITTDLNKVNPQVVINNDSIVVRQDDSLAVDILVTNTQPDAEMSYQWLITQTASSIANPAQYVIGNEKQLRAKIILPPSLYRLVVKVTDKKTNVSYYKFYALNVDTSPWGGEGWLVLQEQPDGSDISIITSRDGVQRGTVYSNLYLGANSHKLPAGTNKVAVMNYSNSMRIQKVSFLYPNGGIQVRSVDYSDSSDHNSWFFIPPATMNIQANAVAPMTGMYETMINDGQLYYQSVNPTSIKTPPIKFGAALMGSWPSLSPNFMMNANGGYTTFFDNVNRCFLHINMSNNTLVPTQPDLANKHWPAYSGTGGATNLAVTGKGYDLNNIGRDLIYTENAQMTDGAIVQPIYYCVFRTSKNDSTFLYQFTSGVAPTNNITTGRYFLKDTANKVPGINNASLFAVPAFTSTAVSNVFYYVPGANTNSIYVCNPSYTGTMPATTTSHLGYGFQPGTVIKVMKVFKSGYTTAPANESRVLVVATDETANGNGNNVYFFNLSATGEINSTPAQVYTGFDKIKDIAFKKGLGL